MLSSLLWTSAPTPITARLSTTTMAIMIEVAGSSLPPPSLLPLSWLSDGCGLVATVVVEVSDEVVMVMVVMVVVVVGVLVGAAVAGAAVLGAMLEVPNGAREGTAVGTREGTAVGTAVGSEVGATVVGLAVGGTSHRQAVQLSGKYDMGPRYGWLNTEQGLPMHCAGAAHWHSGSPPPSI